MWYEGSMHYQFYVLRALFPLMEAAYHSGIDLYQDPGYKWARRIYRSHGYRAKKLIPVCTWSVH